jgi:hypothetical protein
MKKIALPIIAAAALLALGLWMYWPRPPQDLRITGIKIIRKTDVPGLDEPTPPSEPSLPVAVVRFQTSSDLAGLADNFLYQGLYARYALCRSRTKISEGTNLVFDQFGRISFGESGDHGSVTKEYHVYLDLRSVGIPGFSKYDLLKNPEDVCLVLVPESTEFGGGTKTNVLRITRESLKSALASSGQ